MTKIEKYLKRFEAYQNGDLNDKELRSFMHDLEQNKEMQKAWKEYTSLIEAISDKEAISMRDMLEETYKIKYRHHLRTNRQALWLRASIAAVVIISMGALIYYFCAREDRFINLSNDNLMVNTDSVKEVLPMDTNQFDSDTINRNDAPESGMNQVASLYEREEYQINPIYSELLKNVYRGGFFELKSPEDSIVINPGDNLSFNWETNISDSIYFDVLDRNGKVIYTHPTGITSPWTYKPDLSSAIYMYRFATQEEPVWLGVMVMIYDTN